MLNLVPLGTQYVTLDLIVVPAGEDGPTETDWDYRGTPYRDTKLIRHPR